MTPVPSDRDACTECHPVGRATCSPGLRATDNEAAERCGCEESLALRYKLAESEAEVERVVTLAADATKLFQEQRDRAEHAEAEVAGLRQRAEAVEVALREYGRHAKGCSADFGYGCKCGWSNFVATPAPPLSEGMGACADPESQQTAEVRLTAARVEVAEAQLVATQRNLKEAIRDCIKARTVEARCEDIVEEHGGCIDCIHDDVDGCLRTLIERHQPRHGDE